MVESDRDACLHVVTLPEEMPVNEGLELVEAVRAASILRFRPILLTTATTFFGLIPLMLEQAVPATPLVPMAISLGCGVLYASIMTVFLVPAGYVILDDLADRVRTLRDARSGASFGEDVRAADATPR